MKVRLHAKETLFCGSTDLERCVEHDQLGARGHDVVALVGFHEAHVNITLRFSSCEKKKGRSILLEEGEISQGIYNESLETKHTQSLNNHYGSGPLTATLLLHRTDN